VNSSSAKAPLDLQGRATWRPLALARIEQSLSTLTWADQRHALDWSGKAIHQRVRVHANDPAQLQGLDQVESTLTTFNLRDERLWTPELLTHIRLTEAGTHTSLSQFSAKQCAAICIQQHLSMVDPVAGYPISGYRCNVGEGRWSDQPATGSPALSEQMCMKVKALKGNE
jgi:hypothetical protein